MKELTLFCCRREGESAVTVLEGLDSMDQIREYLTEMGFVGHVYEETYHLVSTTPHIVGELA